MLDDETVRALAEALDRAAVVAAFIFGSQASGRATSGSDLDIAVWASRDLDGKARLQLYLDLAAATAAAAPGRVVDLALLNEAPPLLIQRAIGSRVMLLDRDPQERVALESRALVEYLDTIPLREELERGLRRRMREGTFGR